MAQFRKGQSGNPAGRPPGAINLLAHLGCGEDGGGATVIIRKLSVEE